MNIHYMEKGREENTRWRGAWVQFSLDIKKA
jgi:hypothetical protein